VYIPALQLQQHNTKTMVTVTPVDENEKDVFSMDFLGPTLLKDVKGPPVPTAADALKSNKSGIVALYFSASWCPPCQRFTPILIDFYNTAKAANCGFEVVFVSSDRSVEEFDTYVSARKSQYRTRRRQEMSTSIVFL